MVECLHHRVQGGQLVGVSQHRRSHPQARPLGFMHASTVAVARQRPPTGQSVLDHRSLAPPRADGQWSLADDTASVGMPPVRHPEASR